MDSTGIFTPDPSARFDAFKAQAERSAGALDNGPVEAAESAAVDDAPSPEADAPVRNDTQTYAVGEAFQQELTFPDFGPVSDTAPSEAAADTAEAAETADASPELQAAQEHLSARFQQLAQENPTGLQELLTQIYGDKASPEQLQALMRQAETGELPMPEMRFVSSEQLEGHHAAYGNGTVYFSEELRDQPELLNRVAEAEYGHHLDKVLGGEDSLGDEGQMLALGLAQGGGRLSPEDLDAARSLSDHKVMEIDGEQLEVETIAPAVAAGLWWAAKVGAQTTVDTAIDMAIAAVLGVPPPGAGSAIMNTLTNAIPGIGSWRTARKLDKLSKAIRGVRRNMAAIARMPGGQRILTRFNRASREMRDALSSGNLRRAQTKLNEMLQAIQDAHVLRYGDNVASTISRTDFYNNIRRMPAAERVAQVRTRASDYANSRGWQLKSDLKARNNGRDIYFDSQNNRYLSVDTQHGDFEILNSSGRHRGSMDLWGEQTHSRHQRVDRSGGHDIRLN